MRTHSLFGFALLVGACSETTTGTPVTDASLDGSADVSVDASADVSADGATDAGGPTCTVPTPTDPLVARTDRGLVRGAMESEAIHWLGVPFAEPPTGANRWRPTVPGTTCWAGERDATMWAPACPQIPQQQGQPFDPMAPIEGQEDCLTLNVWRPANAPADAALPVMVFIHGGGNTAGSAGNINGVGARLYDATRLAARGNVVVVTLQYRLGALGWLVHPALEGEAGGSAGNLALLDQVAALRWVQRNIRNFRGDPARVMLFGESAGAVNTCALLASPLAAGLFSRALMESGSCVATQTVEAARAQGVMYAEAAGCAAAPDAAACLRALSTEAAVRALAAAVDVSGLGASTVRWGPVTSLPALPTRPLDAMVAGTHNRVPVVVGHNTEEVGLTVPAVPTEAAYRAILTQVGGAAFANNVIARYPVATYGTPRNALVQALTDARFGCGARHAARGAVRGQAGVNVYRYLYGHALEGSTATVRALGAWHGLELAYVFQNIAQGMLAPTANDLAVERAMLGYWTRFAATGDPNGAGAPAWPAYAAGEPLLRIGPTPAVERAWRNAECDAWDMVSRTMVPAP